MKDFLRILMAVLLTPSYLLADEKADEPVKKEVKEEIKEEDSAPEPATEKVESGDDESEDELPTLDQLIPVNDVASFVAWLLGYNIISEANT